MVALQRLSWIAVLAFASLSALGGASPARAAFIDDFEDSDISDWVVRCGGWSFAPGFGGGVAVVSSQFDSVLIHSSFAGGFGHYHYDVYFPNDPVADGDLFFQIVGISFYWILLGPDNSDNVADRIIRVSNGEFGSQTAIGCAPFHLSRETWHRIDVYRFPNGVIQVFTDNEATPRMQAQDLSNGGSGGIAIRTAGAGVRFDNVSFDPTLPANPPAPPPASCPAWGGLLEACSLGSPPPSGVPGASAPVLVAMALLMCGTGGYLLRRQLRTG